MTASTQPTHIKINIQLFLFTKDRHGSMKWYLPFLLVQIQYDDFLWRPQCLPCPPWSKQQDYCMSHKIPTDVTRTKAVCTGYWAGVVETTLHEDTDLRESEGAPLHRFDVSSTTRNASCWLFLILTCTHKICLVLLYSVNVWWILSQKNVQKIIFLLIPQAGQSCISVPSFTTMETYW